MKNFVKQMSQIPRVTVALSALNEERNIEAFLSSVLAQKEEGFVLDRILIISDGSTDNTANVVRNIASSKIELREKTERIGKSSRLNEIYQSVDSDIIVQSDADVVFAHPFVVRDLIKPIVENESVMLCGGNPTPVEGKTFTERAVNCTFNTYAGFRKRVRGGNNRFSADGRLLALRKDFARSIHIPENMIANDAFVFYVCAARRHQYRFVESARVHFRSPQTLRDHIIQNTRFVAMPARMSAYFPVELVRTQEHIPFGTYISFLVGEFLHHPIYCGYIFIINRYCKLRAFFLERSLNARWILAGSTKNVALPKVAKTVRVLIPNATSARNIGDYANLSVLLSIVKKNFPTAHTTIHGVDTHLLPHDSADILDETLYSWAVFQNKNIFVRLGRLFLLGFFYIGMNLGIKVGKQDVSRGTLAALLSDYQNADYIFFLSSGSLRSKKGVTQTLNLLMQLLMMSVAKMSRAKTIAMPFSFGPFGYSILERMTARMLSKFDIVATRGEVSYQALTKHGLKDVVRSVDLALLLEKKNIKKSIQPKTLTLGFTLRNWLPESQQIAFENSIMKAMVQFAHETNCVIAPIVQVHAPEYGDNDASVTELIATRLKQKGVRVLEMKTIKNVDHAKEIYSGIDLLLGMRMHSNILAATENTPFVAIAYEHKTEDIARIIGLEEYCISCEDVTAERLVELLRGVLQNTDSLKRTMDGKLGEMRIREWERWATLFTPTPAI
ncbi:MAG: polysaccharide pyruvyl transferase family protein [Patescibacteria group bacterium]